MTPYVLEFLLFLVPQHHCAVLPDRFYKITSLFLVVCLYNLYTPCIKFMIKHQVYS